MNIAITYLTFTACFVSLVAFLDLFELGKPNRKTWAILLNALLAILQCIATFSLWDR
jgi:hypothetical protein